ncbi:hypothetical protein Pelo_10627 [Pelomyxa schiedti]|nr:hypothetical protein Pelo_10627 [Pelomyxa schiedti]
MQRGWWLVVVLVVVVQFHLSVGQNSTVKYEGIVDYSRGTANEAAVYLVKVSHKVLRLLPHESLSDLNLTSLDTGELKDYAISVGKLALPGFILCLLSLIGLILYCPIMCCCMRKKKPKYYSCCSKYTPVILYLVAAVFVLFALAIGWLGTAQFTSGVTGAVTEVDGGGDEVFAVIDKVVDFVIAEAIIVYASLYNGSSLVSGVPATIDTSVAISQSIVQVNSELSDLAGILNQSVVIPEVNQLKTTTEYLISYSSGPLTELNDLVQEAQDKAIVVQDTINDALNGIGDNEVLHKLSDISHKVMNTTSEVTSKISSTSSTVKHYDLTRELVMNFLSLLPLFSIGLVVLGLFAKKGSMFHCANCCGFITLIWLFLLGALHVLLAIVLDDACLFINSPQGLKVNLTEVVTECREGRSFFDVFNITDRFSFDFEYEDTLDEFADFATTELNLTEVSSFLSSVVILPADYNLTEISSNDTAIEAELTAAQNQSMVTSALARQTLQQLVELNSTLSDFVDDNITQLAALAEHIFSIDDELLALSNCSCLAGLVDGLTSEVCVFLLDSTELLVLSQWLLCISMTFCIFLTCFLIPRFPRVNKVAPDGPKKP